MAPFTSRSRILYGEPGEPDYILSFTVEPGDGSSSPSKEHSVLVETGEQDYIISFPVEPGEASSL